MMEKYEVISYLGDYPLENQPWWDVKFVSKVEAIACAKVQHEGMKLARPDDASRIHTLVQDTNANRVHFLIFNDLETNDPILATSLADDLGYMGEEYR